MEEKSEISKIGSRAEKEGEGGRMASKESVLEELREGKVPDFTGLVELNLRCMSYVDFSYFNISRIFFLI